MPSPRKRAVRAACGNILGGEPSAAQAAYADAWWNTVLTEHSHNYASSNPPFSNGESVLISGTSADYDGLIAGGESGAGTAIRATTTITFAASNFPFMDGGKNITLIDTAGTSMVMTLNNGTGTSGDGVIGGDSIPGNAPAGFGQRFAQAVNATTGNITAAPTDGSSATITLTQDTAGVAGNRTNTTNDTQGDFTLGNFLGGAEALSEALPHFWFDTTNGQAAIADAATAALTTATGVIYDPSGPNSKYISAFEKVSAETAKFVVIKPTGWNANDYITWELIGDTNTNDKLSIQAITTSNSLSAVGGAKADGSVEMVTDKSGTVEYTGIVTHATANAGGVVIKWERDATGGAPGDIKNGWYLRWIHTAV
jgi:hypothetical protein